MSGKPLRMAIVGCGSIGGSAALICRGNRRLKAVMACDGTESRAADFARRHRIPGYSGDYFEMLKNPGFDAVYLGVPHHLHHDMIMAALEAGLPVLTEKPVTRTLAEGRAVAEKAALLGIKLGVNFQHRYNPGCYALASAVQTGRLGTIHSARINIPWRREIDYFNKAPWHAGIATAGGGTLITQGSHFLDIVLWAMNGDSPVSAAGYTARRRFTRLGDGTGAQNGEIEVEDLCHGIVEMKSGALVQVSSSMVARPQQGVSIEVYGDKGTILYRHRPFPHVRFVGIPPLRIAPPVRGFHPMQASFEGFRRWISGDVPFLTPAESTLRTLSAVEAIYASAASGLRQPITD